jgi:hypothetical protein
MNTVSNLGLDDGVGRADLHTGGVLAVLADVRHHQEGLAAPCRDRLVNKVGACGQMLDELHVAPVLSVELPRVVEAVKQEVRLVALEAVPLLAGDLACLAPDADAGVSEEAGALYSHPFRTPSGWA